MHVEIKQILSITREDIEKLGFNGYVTDTIFTINKVHKDDIFEMSITKKKLDKEYTKIWKTKDNSVDFFNEVIKFGHSYGLYMDDDLVGFILLSHINWNNTLWIENIRIKQALQGQELGLKLIDTSIKVAREIGARLVGLETQSTNYPAIQFYKKCGFEVTGIDLKRYPQIQGDLEQVGLLMSYNIR